MLKNKIFVLLLLFGSVFGVTTTYSDQILNGTQINIPFGDCITLYSPANNFSATTICSPVIIPTTLTLQPEATFINTSLGITIYGSPKLNITKHLIYNESVLNIAYGLNITAPQATPAYKANLDKQITFGENYTDIASNLTVRAPAFPSLNAFRNLTAGEFATALDNDLRFNYSFYCIPAISQCKQNENVNLNFAQDYRNEICNITVHAPTGADLGLNANVKCGEKYTNTDYNISIEALFDNSTCFQNFNQTLNESYPVYNNNLWNISVDAVFKNYSAIMWNLEDNATCNVTTTLSTGQTYCSDNILSVCGAELTAKGDPITCIRNLAETTSKDILSLQIQVAEKELVIKRYMDVEAQRQTEKADDQDFQFTIFGLVAIGVAGLAIVIFLFYKQKMDMSRG